MDVGMNGQMNGQWRQPIRLQTAVDFVPEFHEILEHIPLNIFKFHMKFIPEFHAEGFH